MWWIGGGSWWFEDATCGGWKFSIFLKNIFLRFAFITLVIAYTQCIVVSTMLYNRIAVLRSERALSRQALAREVGVNPQTIGFLERGDYTPSLELAFKISRFFKLPVEAVFSPDPFRLLSEQVYEMQRREA